MRDLTPMEMHMWDKEMNLSRLSFSLHTDGRVVELPAPSCSEFSNIAFLLSELIVLYNEKEIPSTLMNRVEMYLEQAIARDDKGHDLTPCDDADVLKKAIFLWYQGKLASFYYNEENNKAILDIIQKYV